MEDNYKKLCDEYAQKIKYPEYGEWCKETIFKTIKEYGISDKVDEDLFGFSDKEKPALLCGYRSYAFKNAPKEQQCLSVGELVTKTYELEHYGVMVELEDNFYQTIME